ncbi:LETM1-related biofilm-associated protein [Muriicola sp.]|uniref:LETM1-related biofilm-associated protein n=1 Tax=Muriicola sp. TaxID=2020856 RepID=UPI0035694487
MNPSGPGWINKFGEVVRNKSGMYPDFSTLYSSLKEYGFVYGINVDIPAFIKIEHPPSDDERAKINLLVALYFTFSIERREGDFEEFLETIFAFYRALNIGRSSFLNNLLTGKKTSDKLETLIDSRVYLDENVITRTFNSVITNSLLFIDVLTFRYYLRGEKDLVAQAQKLEYLTINITYHALNAKEKNRSDEKLSQLFAASLTFIDAEEQKFDGSYREILMENCSPWENQYFLDVASLTVWEDYSLDYKESQYIYGIGKDMGFEEKQIADSLEEITIFFKKNIEKITFLKDTNLAVQFYDSMARVVNKLILRNSKRLQKELAESKDLVFLISKGAVKELSASEKKKVQDQLMDIFKSVPSLAIFMLPGGAVLLPIFIKLIPTLLPSSFDENRVVKKEETPRNKDYKKNL